MLLSKVTLSDIVLLFRAPFVLHFGCVFRFLLSSNFIITYFQERPITTSFQSDNKKTVFQRVGTLIGGKKSKDKMATVSEEDRVAQLTKELEQCREERDRYKVAHLTSEVEKKELITKMDFEDKLKAKEIEILKMAQESLITKMDGEAKLKSVEIEKFKRESDNLSEKLQANRKEIDRCKNELRLKDSRITEMNDEIKSQSAEIEKLKAEREQEAKLKAVEIEILKINHANAEREWKSSIAKMECDANSKANEIEFIQKMESERKSRITQLEKEVEATKNRENNKNNFILCGEVKRGFEKVGNNLRSLLDRPTDMTIRWKFTEISKLTKNNVNSQPTEFAGITWRIQVKKCEDDLNIFLKADKFGAAKWSCSVVAEFQLISQKDSSIIARKGWTNKPVVHNESAPSWGFPIIPFKDLHKGDAVKDDSIIVAVVIKAFPSR